MNKVPHKHAELIKAWADGAVIQVRNTIGHSDHPAHVWTTISGSPYWDASHVYRIKPEEKSYALIYLEAGYPEATYGFNDLAKQKQYISGVEAVIQEFCKRNNLDRSEMK